MENGQYYWIDLKMEEGDEQWLGVLLMEGGATGVEELEIDNRLIMRAFCDCAPQSKNLALLWKDRLLTQGQDDNRDWNLHWRNRQKPVKVGKNLLVVPPWVKNFEPGTKTVFTMEASLAFGTGEHESTSLLISLMDDLEPEPDTQVFDVGTGTGILAMFAVAHWNSNCSMNDIDPDIFPVLQKNFRGNKLGEPSAFLGPLTAIAGKNHFDVLLCNMIRSEIWPLRKDFRRLVVPGGRLILSGQLFADRDILLKWFEEERWIIESEKRKNEWWAVCCHLENGESHV